MPNSYYAAIYNFAKSIQIVEGETRKWGPAQEAPRKLAGGSRRPQKATRKPQHAPGGPRRAPGGLQEAPRSPPGGLLEAPVLPCAPREPQGPRGNYQEAPGGG